jgi:hypothetical protein
MFSPLSQYLWVNNPFTDYQFTKKTARAALLVPPFSLTTADTNAVLLKY